MSLKVAVSIQVGQMDGTEITAVQKLDTVISPDPRDPTADALMARPMVERLVTEALEETTEHLDEYIRAMVRLMQGSP